MNPSVTVYTTTLCPVCRMVKDFLNIYEITFTEVSVDLRPLSMVKLIRKTKKLTVPQTNINGKWIFGFDPAQMMQAWNDPLVE